jgi:hypothetical protein
MEAFVNTYAEETRTLEEEEADLRRKLQELAVQISNGNDVTICLDIALEDDERIFKNRGMYESTF